MKKLCVSIFLCCTIISFAASSAHSLSFIFDSEDNGICHWSSDLVRYLFTLYSTQRMYETVASYAQAFLNRSVTGSDIPGLSYSFMYNRITGNTSGDNTLINYGAVAYDQSVLGRAMLYGGVTTILDTYVTYTTGSWLTRDDNPLVKTNVNLANRCTDASGNLISYGTFKLVRIEGRDLPYWWNLWDWAHDTGAAACLALYAVEAYQKLLNTNYLAFAQMMCDYILKLQDTDGGIRFAPVQYSNNIASYTNWNIKSTEQNERSWYALQALYNVTKDQKYSTGAANITSWLKTMYDPAFNLYHRGANYNGTGWTLDGWNKIATDVMAFAVVDLMFADPYFGATQELRDAEVDNMFQTLEARNGYFENGELKIFRFYENNGTANNYGSVEWSAQVAEAYLRVARYYYCERRNWAKAAEYLNKYHHLMRSLDGFFHLAPGSTDAEVAPYASYFDGSVAGNVWVYSGEYESINSEAALASTYYALARLKGLDPDMPQLLGGGVIETYYANGLVRTRYNPISDPDGFIYFEYLNEDYQAQGYGRVEKARRETALNGVLSYKYSYYADAAGHLQAKSAYSDANWTTLVATHTYYNDAAGRIQSMFDIATGITTTYYNDASGRMESKTLAAADASGNIYYHYINEDQNSQGYGRVDKAKRQTALNGGLSYAYSYYDDAVYISNDVVFVPAGANISDYISAASEGDTLVLAEGYYTCTLNINKAICLKGQGQEKTTIFGRMDVSAAARVSDFTISGSVVPMSGVMEIRASNVAIEDVTILNSSIGGSAVTTRGGAISGITFKDCTIGGAGVGSVYFYSDASVIFDGCHIYTTATPGAAVIAAYCAAVGYFRDCYIAGIYGGGGAIVWSGSGHFGTFTLERCYVDGGPSILAWGGTINLIDTVATSTVKGVTYGGTVISDDFYGRLQASSVYSDANWTTLVSTSIYYNDATGRLQSRLDAATGITTTYYNDATGRTQSRTLASPDAYGNSYYHYINENWASLGYGRVDKARRQTALNGESSYTYSYYADATGRLQTKRSYSDGAYTTLVATCTYYNDAANLMESKTLVAPDAPGNIYYHYINEAASKVDKSKRQTALNGELSYTYVYYADANGRLQTKRSYSDAGFTTLVATYTYNNDAANRLASKLDAATNTTYTYYNDATNRVESKTLTAADASGNIYYHYINENWISQGFGRVDQVRRLTALSGILSSKYTYYADITGRLQTAYTYSDANWTALVATYTYYNDASGRLRSKFNASTGVTNTYYNDATNLVESKTLAAPDGGGNIYYTYMNENWNNQGYGRVLKAQRPDGSYILNTSYWGSTTIVKTREVYSKSGAFLCREEYDSYGDLTKIIYASGIVDTAAEWKKETNSLVTSTDLDSNGTKEVIADFGTNGFYKYENAVWTKLSTLNADTFVVSDLTGNGTKEIIADFGASGFWKYEGAAWTKLNAFNADSFAIADLNGDGTKEIMADFGANGFYKYENAVWTKLSTLNADSFTVLDLNGNGTREIIADFGAGGFYKYENTAWTKITTLNADSFTASDLNGNGTKEIIADFGAGGFYKYEGTALTKLSTLNADSFSIADLTGDGTKEIIADFGASGLWKYEGTTWTRLTTLNADTFAVSDLTGDGTKEIMADFGANGFYKYENAVWTKLSTLNADSFTVLDLNGNGTKEIIADFGAGGFYKYENAVWIKLSTLNADSFTVLDLNGNGTREIIADFGAGGFYKYEGAAWTKLSTLNALSFIVSDLDANGTKEIVADFGAGGLYKYEGAAGTKISTLSPGTGNGIVTAYATYVPRGDEETASRMSLESTLTQDKAGTNYSQTGTLADQPMTKSLLPKL